MKFLKIFTMKDTFSMLSPATQRQLMEMSVVAVDELKKNGTILEVYYTPGQFIFISDYPSHEALVEKMASVLGFMDVEVYPLADFHKSVEALIEACKQAEMLFPGTPK